MALIIVISTGDFQIRRNVLSLSFSERESGEWFLGLSGFDHNYIISKDCIQHSGKISICNTWLKQFFVQQHGFLCRVLLSKSAVIRTCSNFSNIIDCCHTQTNL